MAAVSLKDLISAKKSLEQKDQQPERMTVADLRKIMEDQTKTQKAQVVLLQDIKGTALQDKTIQLAQAALEVKMDRDLNKDEAEALETSKEILKANKEIAKELKKHGKVLETMSPDKAKKLAEKATGLEQFKTIGERVQDAKAGFKDFFSLKGFLNRTGLVDKSSTGIVATAVNRRAAKMQYVQDRMRIDPNLKNLKQFGGDEQKVRISLEKQFDKQQEARSAIRATSKDIAGLEKRGYSESQIARTGLYDDLSKHTSSLEKVDPRIREHEKEATKTAAKETETKTDKQNRKAATVKLAAEEKADKKKADTTAVFAEENEVESDRESAKQTDLLAKIEENTRPAHAAGDAKPQEDAKGGKGIFGSIMEGISGLLGDGLMMAFKSLFNPRMILKALGKVFVPAMLIGAVVNGLIDGFKVFFNGGSFTDALIAGLGGILDFLTFGLIDAETLKSIVNFFSDLVDKYIVEPIKKLFDFFSDVFQEYIVKPLADFLKPLTDFFKNIKDTVVGFFTNFEIPGISFKIPVIDKEISLGPWKPFASDQAAPADQAGSAAPSSTAAAAAPAATEANAVYNKSGENAQAAMPSSAPAAPVIVNAPTNVSNGTQNFTVPQPVRNGDGGLSRYMQKNSAFL